MRQTRDTEKETWESKTPVHWSHWLRYLTFNFEPESQNGVGSWSYLRRDLGDKSRAVVWLAVRIVVVSASCNCSLYRVSQVSRTRGLRNPARQPLKTHQINSYSSPEAGLQIRIRNIVLRSVSLFSVTLELRRMLATAKIARGSYHECAAVVSRVKTKAAHYSMESSAGMERLLSLADELTRAVRLCSVQFQEFWKRLSSVSIEHQLHRSAWRMFARALWTRMQIFSFSGIELELATVSAVMALSVGPSSVGLFTIDLRHSSSRKSKGKLGPQRNIALFSSHLCGRIGLLLDSSQRACGWFRTHRGQYVGRPSVDMYHCCKPFGKTHPCTSPFLCTIVFFVSLDNSAGGRNDLYRWLYKDQRLLCLHSQSLLVPMQAQCREQVWRIGLYDESRCAQIEANWFRGHATPFRFSVNSLFSKAAQGSPRRDNNMF